jgi:hypothetical protein
MAKLRTRLMLHLDPNDVGEAESLLRAFLDASSDNSGALGTDPAPVASATVSLTEIPRIEDPEPSTAVLAYDNVRCMPQERRVPSRAPSLGGRARSGEAV